MSCGVNTILNMSKSCFRTGKYLFNHIVYTFRTYENSRSYSSLFITNSKLYSSSFINKLDIAINYINQNFIHSSSVCGIRFDGRHAEGRRALKSRKEESDYVETTFSDNIRGWVKVLELRLKSGSFCYFTSNCHYNLV